MKRGDIVTVALQGDFGKPRPAVIVESDRLPPTETVLVCLMTSTLRDDAPFRRHPVDASTSTGLRVSWQVMVDKVFAVRRSECGSVIGTLDRASLREVTRKLGLVIGMAD